MNDSWLADRMREWQAREALVGASGTALYGDLLDHVADWHTRLRSSGIGRGHTVAFAGDFDVRTVSLLLALREQGCISVPLASVTTTQQSEFMKIANADTFVDCRGPGLGAIHRMNTEVNQPLVDRLVTAGRPGLVLFSSGSTGRAKAVLHDFDLLLEKFHSQRQPYRAITFLLLDHIGGINTLFYALSNGGTVVTCQDRTPAAVCDAIQRHRVELLPTTPTFLNLLLMSGEYSRCDLSSLRLITYGTEVMPSSTLNRIREVLPHVQLKQTYGLSELGIMRSVSRPDGSVWIQVGGDGYETKIVDGVLWIRAKFAMLGYLNAPSPFDSDGWFNTEDAVEQDGPWLRFLGRTSDVINVGGLKVYPAQVESVLLEMENVLDATVRGERNSIVGQCVVARVNLRDPEAMPAFKDRMRRHCQGRLSPYMVPVKVEITECAQHNARGKRVRKGSWSERGTPIAAPPPVAASGEKER